MASHKRVKDIDYDEDDMYSGDEGDYDNTGGDGLTEEDKENFATLTPVVRAELDEGGARRYGGTGGGLRRFGVPLGRTTCVAVHTRCGHAGVTVDPGEERG